MAEDYRAQVPDGRFRARMIRTLPGGTKLGFEWHGGDSIDVFKHAAWSSTPQETIGVWDYAADQPLVPRTRAGMKRAVDEWIAEYPVESLVHDVRENWL